MTDSVATFEIRLVCLNCSHKWEIDVPRETEVKSGYGGVWLHPDDCIGSRGFDCKGSRPECPNCGRAQEVRTR